jgi:hypothetical protein
MGGMSYKREFYDVGQAQSYLTGSVIRLNGEPVYVCDIGSLSTGGWNNNFYLYYNNVGNDNGQGKVEYQDTKVDVSPLPLGLVNWPGSKRGDYPGSILWTSRIPRRGWKVGLSTSSLFLGGDPAVYRYIEKGHLIMSSPFRQTVVRNYPSFEKIAEKKWKEGVHRIAFSHRFYLTHQGNVGYKNFPSAIGEWNAKGIVLDDAHQYLQEVLDEDLT